jgi:hypothetical protein
MISKLSLVLTTVMHRVTKLKTIALLAVAMCANMVLPLHAQLNVPTGSVGNSLNGNVGIDVTEPREKLQIGDRWTFHNGGHKVMGYNCYHSSGDKRLVDAASAAMRFTNNGDIQFSTAPFNTASTPIVWNIPLFLANTGSAGFGTTAPEGVQINTALFSEQSRGVSNVRIGVLGTPRIIFDHAGYTPFEIDNASGRFRIFTPGVERFTINGNGKVGIGTASPITQLDVMEGFYSGTETGIFIGQNHDSGANTGRYGIGLSFEHTDGTSQGKKYYLNTWFGNSMRRTISFDHLGNVGVGTLDPKGYKLAIAGKAVAEEIVVKVQGSWPDYVFDTDYQLPSLTDVEQFIKANKHLPEVPSAAAVKEHGLSVGEMNAVLLKKIEELTLYVIQLKKENEEIEILKQRLDKLENK